MGCDIHIYVERRGNKKWHSCDYFVPNINYNGTNSEYSRVETCGDRNYSLFATLANVRNYGNTDFICEPKGFPDDASEYVKHEYESDDSWAHSCSYLTLQELINFQREKHPLKHRGMISPEAQRLLDENGVLPDSWCQGTNQVGYEFREWEENIDILEPLINDLKKRADELNMIYGWSWDSKNEDTRRSAYKAAANIRTSVRR